MMEQPMTVVTLKERFDLFQAADDICTKAWPEFMLQDPVAHEHWMTFIEAYKEYQVLVMEGDTILAIVNSIPLRYEGALADLPEEGWDWGVKKAVQDLREGCRPNTLFGVQVVINPEHQGRGLSAFATKQMLNLVERHHLERLIIPVRPNRKADFPLIPMEDYLQWKNDKGEVFDSWLRVHVKCGATVVKICHRAMEITGSLEDWKNWTGKDFPGSGSFLVDGALGPITVDFDRKKATYIEPNVWVVYEAKETP
jgi:hypothetical protein